MNAGRYLWLVLLVGMTGVWIPDPAAAVTVSGRSSTEIEWIDVAGQGRGTPMYEYLLLNLKDIDGNGLNFRAYGRLADDPSGETDTESRLYHAYLEKRDLLPHLDVKLGRQFVTSVAGASVMDGLSLKAKQLGPFSLTLFGGGDVGYYAGYDTKDLIDGVSFAGQFGDNLNLQIAYLQKWQESELTHELMGAGGEYDLARTVRFFADLQYNNLASKVSYFNGGLKYHRNPAWSLSAEYLYSLPVFSSTSIYSVFAVSEYEEISGTANVNLGDGWRSFVRYTREIYQADNDTMNVAEAGVEKIRTDRFSGYLTGVLRENEMRGVKGRLACRINRYLQVGIGAHLDVLEREIDTAGGGTGTDQTTSSRLWADTTVYFTQKVNLEAKVERIESDHWDQYYNGRLRLNILF